VRAWLGDPAGKPLWLGFTGSVVILLGALGAGGVLVHDPVLEGTPLVAWRFGHGYDLAVMTTYLGLALEVWAWVLLGREVIAHRAGARGVLTTALVWILPILISPPLFTRDPYSYLAYGELPLRGFDPYSHGPSVLSGPILDNVHPFWRDTPGMYGPLFIAISKAVVSVTGENMIAGVLALRLILVLGLIPLVAAIPGLCRHLGGRVPTALWIIVANPVMLVVLIGGPHNDLLVIGFLSLGALLVLNRREASGIALVTLAVAVKGTAALALPFLVLVWATRFTGTRRVRILKASAAGLAVFVEIFVLCSLIGQVGLGWLVALNAPTQIVNWLSLPTGVGQILFNLTHVLFNGVVEAPFTIATRVLGVLGFLYLAVKQWLAARDGGPDAVRRAGVVLLLFALLSPATLPWYYTWGAVLLATTTATVRRMQIALLASVFLIISAFPDGEIALYSFGYLLLVMTGAAIAAIALRTPDPRKLRALASSPEPAAAPDQ